MENTIPGLGADHSQKDSRTVKNEEVTKVSPIILVKGGIDYSPSDILNQHAVGICTSISCVQLHEKTTGKKYSPDFQYLLQKKFYDLNWYEGSSILVALKVAKNYGFLPLSLWSYTTETDRQLSYAQYITKLQAIPDLEVLRLLGLCVDAIPGYALIDVTSSQSIAQAINDSDAGILCRYDVGDEWWTSLTGVVSWSPKDIDPLRPPQTIISGHAITMSKFDYSEVTGQFLQNSWGTLWDNQGTATVIWDKYKMTEAWAILKTPPVIPTFTFQHDLYFGLTSADVLQLQIILNKNIQTQVAQSGVGSIGLETKYFGGLTLSAVKRWQALNGVPATGYFGPISRAKMNSIL